MSRKVLGWNINQRSGLGKEIPELVFQELLAQDADIIVLTEVVKNCRIPGTHKVIWRPIAMLGIGVLYTILYTIDTALFSL